VDDVFSGSLIDLFGRYLQRLGAAFDIASLDSSTDILDQSTDLRFDRTIAEAVDFVLA